MVRVMLSSKKLPVQLWTSVVNNVGYIVNLVCLRTGTLQTPYKIGKDRKLKPQLFPYVWGQSYVLNDIEHLGKFDHRSYEGMLIVYSKNSSTYIVYNMMTQTIIKSINVEIDDTGDFSSY